MKVKILTVGCRLNKAETAQIEAILSNAGYEIIDKESPADIYLIHSCAVTARAEEDSLRLCRIAKNQNPKSLVILAGCLSELFIQKNKQNIQADIILGQKDKFNIIEALEKKQYLPKLKPQKDTKVYPIFRSKRAIIKVQTGCSFNCSYCIVPKTRGPSTSRPMPEILEEVRIIAEKYPEIVLTGANLGCYEYKGKNLIDLIKAITEVPQIKRIRLSSIEISTIENKIIDIMAENEKICRYLHLPLQSGDDKTLQRMKRRYTLKQYINTIEYAINKLGTLGIGTDIIVGFPGETEEEFSNTYKILEKLPFSNIHVFSFSPREGTEAYSLQNRINRQIISSRVNLLLQLAQHKKNIFAKQFIGKNVETLIEKVDSQKNIGKGWTKEYVFSEISATTLYEKQIIKFTPELSNNGILIGKI